MAAAALLFLLLISAGVFYVYQSIQSTLGEDSDEADVAFRKSEPFTVLLLGVDEREGDAGRSDTMILASVRKDSIEMVSIPRDTRVEIAGRGTEDKINHAYAFGGIDMAVKTVEQFLDMPVDYYVEMNMDGLKDLVNAVGGIEVDNSFAFSYGGSDFGEGRIQLDGEEALNYARMRYEDPNGDFGRQDRQRQVIQAVLEKGTDPGVVFKYGSILRTISSNVKTNITIGNIAAIQKNYGEARQNITSESIEGEGQMMDGVYYYIVSEEERGRIGAQLKKE